MPRAALESRGRSVEGQREMAASERPNCMQCRHFFITWLGDFPRGCRAYRFRSPEYPSIVVLRESGLGCQLFERRHCDDEDAAEGVRKGRLVH